MKNNSILAFLAGAAIGATVALLLAPDSGKNTREKIAGKIREGRDRVRDLYEEGREKVGEWVDEGCRRAKNAVGHDEE